MFTAFLIYICCWSLVAGSSVDTKPDEKYIDGREFSLKNLDAKYKQRVSNEGQCSVELHDQGGRTHKLNEGEIIKVKTKWFKVEDCRLNRAYLAACGSPLFRTMQYLVCSLVEQHYEKIMKRQHTEEGSFEDLDTTHTNECCKSACTVSELLQYCVFQR